MQKTTEEGKTSSSVDSRLKISGMTDDVGFPERLYHPVVRHS